MEICVNIFLVSYTLSISTPWIVVNFLKHNIAFPNCLAIMKENILRCTCQSFCQPAVRVEYFCEKCEQHFAKDIPSTEFGSFNTILEQIHPRCWTIAKNSSYTFTCNGRQRYVGIATKHNVVSDDDSDISTD